LLKRCCLLNCGSEHDRVEAVNWNGPIPRTLRTLLREAEWDLSLNDRKRVAISSLLEIVLALLRVARENRAAEQASSLQTEDPGQIRAPSQRLDILEPNRIRESGGIEKWLRETALTRMELLTNPPAVDQPVHSLSIAGAYIIFYREAGQGMIEIEGRDPGMREWVIINISKTRSTRDADTGLFSIEALDDTRYLVLHRENFGRTEVIEQIDLRKGDYLEFHQSRIACCFNSPKFVGEIRWYD